METKAILEADLAALTRKLFHGPDDLFAKLPSDQLARLRGSALVAQRHYAEAGLAKLLGAATADGGTPGSAEIDRTAHALGHAIRREAAEEEAWVGPEIIDRGDGELSLKVDGYLKLRALARAAISAAAAPDPSPRSHAMPTSPFHHRPAPSSKATEAVMSREMTEAEEHALDRAEAALDSLADEWMAENTEMRVSVAVIGQMAPPPFRERLAAQVDQMVRLAYREGLYHGFFGHKDMAAGRAALAKDGEEQP